MEGTFEISGQISYSLMTQGNWSLHYKYIFQIVTQSAQMSYDPLQRDGSSFNKIAARMKKTIEEIVSEEEASEDGNNEKSQPHCGHGAGSA